jgi:hypothetical protein
MCNSTISRFHNPTLDYYALTIFGYDNWEVEDSQTTLGAYIVVCYKWESNTSAWFASGETPQKAMRKSIHLLRYRHAVAIDDLDEMHVASQLFINEE